jgi:hypothetical protein
MNQTKDNFSPEAQRKRWERGQDFQEEFRESLKRVPSCWFKRLPDGAGPQPFDTLALLKDFNLGIEFKRLKGRFLSFNDLRPNQVQGLQNFHKVLPQNVGVVVVHFFDEDMSLDECFMVPFVSLVNYFLRERTLRVSLTVLRSGELGPRLPRSADRDGWALVPLIYTMSEHTGVKLDADYLFK